jgi:hypothetical protein
MSSYNSYNFLDRQQDPSAFATVNLLNLVSHSNPQTVGEILENRNGGIYPTRTQEELELLESGGLIARADIDNTTKYQATHLGKMELLLQGVRDPSEVRRVIDSAYAELERVPPKLPAEKYGNEEFRFTWESVAALTRKIVKDNSYVTPRVLALGAPTIAYFGALCGSVVDSYLLDVNHDIIEDVNSHAESGVKAAFYDARDPIPPTFEGKFDAVVFDPPWHNEFYSLFADRGYDFLRPFGKLYISTPAPATRPEAAGELNDIYTGLIRGGFNLIEVTPEFFGYQIPEFERNVFAGHGIDVRSRGKYGQLVVAQATPNRKDTCSTSESIRLANQERCYSIKARDGNAELDLGDIYAPGCDPTLLEDSNTPLTVTKFSDGIYTTTSRSQRRAEGVNFITRGHIAFTVTNPGRLMKLCGLYDGSRGDSFTLAIQKKLELTEAEAAIAAQEFYKIINTSEDGK